MFFFESATIDSLMFCHCTEGWVRKGLEKLLVSSILYLVCLFKTQYAPTVNQWLPRQLSMSQFYTLPDTCPSLDHVLLPLMGTNILPIAKLIQLTKAIANSFSLRKRKPCPTGTAKWTGSEKSCQWGCPFWQQVSISLASGGSELSNSAPCREGIFKGLFIHITKLLHREIEEKQ